MNKVIIGSGNGLWPVVCEIIIWINADLLSTGSLRTHFREVQTKYKISSSAKLIWKCYLPFWSGFSVLKKWSSGTCLLRHTSLVAITGRTSLAPYHSAQSLKLVWRLMSPSYHLWITGGHFKNTYELLNPRALKISKLYRKSYLSMYG